MAGGFTTKLLLAFLVLTFAVWGIEDMVRQPAYRMTVATVGNTKVSMLEYQRAVRQETENLRQMLGTQYTPEIAKQLQIERRALQPLLQKALLKQETEALGISPGDADVVRRIRANSGFQDSKGNFDKSRFEAALRNAGYSEKSYVETMRQEIAAGLLMDTLSVPVKAPDIAVETLYKAREGKRTATIYTLGESLVNVPAPDEAALETYYKDHGQAFSVPEYRTVSYVVINPADVHASVKISEEDILAAYKERIDEFKRPEQRVTDQLIYDGEADAKKAYDLLKSGKSFDEVAKTTAITNKGATSLGKVQKSNVLEEATSQVFSIAAGEITTPVKSPFGWHIFRVRSIEPPSTAPLDDVRGLLEKDVKQRTQEEAGSKLMNHLEDALAGGSSLSEAAKEFHLKLQTIGPIAQDGKSPNGSAVKLPDLDHFLDTTFKTEEKTESPLINASGGRYYILSVDTVTPARLKALSEVRGEVTAAWQKQARAKKLHELASETAKQIADKSTRGSALNKIKTAYSGALSRSSDKAGGLTLPNVLVADVFSRAPGESTDAYALSSGEYAIAVAGEHIAAGMMDKTAADKLRNGLERDMQQERMEQYLAYLMKKYPVEVNESLLQQTTDE